MRRTFAVPRNLRNWGSANSGGSAGFCEESGAIRTHRRATGDWRRNSAIGSPGWRKKPGGLLRFCTRASGSLGRQRPAERFGEAIENLACRALHRHALLAKTVEKNGAIGSVEGKKVRAAKKIGALRIFF